MISDNKCTMKIQASIIGLLLLGSTVARAQTDGFLFNYMGMGASTALVTDYQTIGINPANLGLLTPHSVAFEIGGGGFSLFSNGLTKSALRNFSIGNTTVAFKDLLGEGYRVETRINVLAMSFCMGKAGTLAVSFGLRLDQSFRMGGVASSLFFEEFDYEGYFDTIVTSPDGSYGVSYDPLSLSEITDSTQLNFKLQSAVDLAWGRQWYAGENLNLYAGVGARYVMSYAYVDFSSEAGVIGGQAALGLDLVNTPDFVNTYDVNQQPFQPVGTGFGFDIGVTAELYQNLRLSGALVNIGNLNYTLNTLEFNDIVLDTVYYDGIESTTALDVVSTILDEEEIIAYEGIESFSTPLPTTLRLGASYNVTNFLTVAGDVNLPVSTTARDFGAAQIGMGARVTVARFIQLSTGFTSGGGYGFNIPAGLVFNFPFTEFGVGTRDIAVFFGEENPTISWAFCVLRFKI